MDYHYVILDDTPSAAAAALSVLAAEGVNLVGFSEFPHGPGKTQLDLIAPESQSLAKTASDMGLTVSRAKTGFVIRGDGAPGPAVAEVLFDLLIDCRIDEERQDDRRGTVDRHRDRCRRRAQVEARVELLRVIDRRDRDA